MLNVEINTNTVIINKLHILLEIKALSSSSCVASTTRAAQRQTQTSVARVDDSEPQLSPHPGRDCLISGLAG